MAFGIPGSATGSDSGPFLARVQYDSRSGFFTNVNRVQGADGQWQDSAGEPYRGLMAAFDFGSFEAGYIKFASPPSFLLVPYLGPVTAFPPQPEEMTNPGKPGEKPRRAFQPGFRIKVMGKAFGDGDPRYFAHTGKGVVATMEELYQAFASAPEASRGLIPVAEAKSTRTLETSGPRGTTKNYAPVWTIVQWIERPAGFGERTVPAPIGTGAAPAPRPAAPPPAAAQPAPSMAADMAEPLPF